MNRKIKEMIPANGWVADFSERKQRRHTGRIMNNISLYSYYLIGFALVENEDHSTDILGIVNVDGKNVFCEECKNFIGYNKRF